MNTPQLQRLIGAVRGIKLAIRDKGPAPVHHDDVMKRHRREWPTLWEGLDHLLFVFDSQIENISQPPQENENLLTEHEALCILMDSAVVLDRERWDYAVWCSAMTKVHRAAGRSVANFHRQEEEINKGAKR